MTDTLQDANPRDVAHLVSSPRGSAPYCGYMPRYRGDLLGQLRLEEVRTVLYLDQVECSGCLTEAMRRCMDQMRDLDPEVPAEAADLNDLDVRLKEAAEQLGLISLKMLHPSAYAKLLAERNRPDEPADLLAVVADDRGRRFVRIAVSSVAPWREVGTIRLMSPAESDDPQTVDYRWEDLEPSYVIWEGLDPNRNYGPLSVQTPLY